MNIGNNKYTSIWYEETTDQVFYIDQTKLPGGLIIREMKTFEDGVRAIHEMEVRGAPLIGVAAAFAMYVGLDSGKGTQVRHPLLPKEGAGGWSLMQMADILIATRPTAVNLAWAVSQMLNATEPSLRPQASQDASMRPYESLRSHALAAALEIRRRELDHACQIGLNGLRLLEAAHAKAPSRAVNILTHCNAGWLATVDYGTALAPIYLAHDKGIPVHVWVDETRPRNQGAKLTAYELTQHGVPNTLIVDNAGGLLMQQGRVDMVIVGADRITANGDVVNKVGTYLKALAAFDNGVPFYVAAPSSTFDKNTPSGSDVIIEERSSDEILFLDGHRIAPEGTRVLNPGFDVTPARLVSEYITEGGLKRFGG